MANRRFSSTERRRLAQDAARLKLQDSDMFVLLGLLANEVDTAFAKKVAQIAVVRDVKAVLQLSVDPRDYEDPEVYFWDRQLAELLRKFPFQGTSKATRDAAIDSFYAAEERCKETNERIRRVRLDADHPDNLLLWEVRRKIGQVLGEFHPERWLEASRFGPGSTLSTPSFDTCGTEIKYGVKPSFTPSLVPFFGHVLADVPSWQHSIAVGHNLNFELVQGNKITTVPKNAKTDRTIAVEPHINQYLQLGLGHLIRKRLFYKAGIDLNKGETYHKRLAKLASRDNSLATIDLSAASDTISYELVKTLLPLDWFHALALCRSPVGTLDGRTITYEKFSSMGNGATFELETLIFYSIASVIATRQGNSFNPSVYGDDIIVASETSSDLLRALSSCGFAVNESKSFVDPCYFRESCGGDYFKGVDVRPIYITKRIMNALQLSDLANRIWEVASRRNNHFCCDAKFFPTWLACHRWIPRNIRRVISCGTTVPGTLWVPGMSLDVSPVTGTMEVMALVSQPKKATIPQTLISVEGECFEGPPTRDDVNRGSALMASRLQGVMNGNRTALRGRNKLVFKPVKFPVVFPELSPW